MNKIVIQADSHQLSQFERCKRSYYWPYVVNIEGMKDKAAFLKGNAMHDLLFHFYSSKIKSLPYETCCANAFSMAEESIKKLEMGEKLLITQKFAEYCEFYRREILTPIGVEVGFSKTFYEDDRFHFIYEGKIDFIAEIERGRYVWVDHKTQAYAYKLIPETNQFMGYSWALGYNTGMINYIGLQKSYAPKDSFRREICTYKASLIDEWKSTMLRLFFQLASASLSGNKMEAYDKQRTSCTNKWGICEYLRLCNEVSPNIINGIASQEYKSKEIWSPWELEE